MSEPHTPEASSPTHVNGVAHEFSKEEFLELWNAADSSSDESSLGGSPAVSPKNGAIATFSAASASEDSDSDYAEAHDSNNDFEVESESESGPTGDSPQQVTKKGNSNNSSPMKKKKSPSPKKNSRQRGSASSPPKTLPTICMDDSDADEEIPLFTDIRKTLDSSVGMNPRSNLPYLSSPFRSPSKRGFGRQMSTPNFSPNNHSSPASRRPGLPPLLPRSMSVNHVQPPDKRKKIMLSAAQASNRKGWNGDDDDSDDSSVDYGFDDDIKQALIAMAKESFQTPQTTKPKLDLKKANKTTDAGFTKPKLKKSSSMVATTKKSSKGGKKSKPKKPTSLVDLKSRRKNSTHENLESNLTEMKSKSSNNLSSLKLPMSPDKDNKKSSKKSSSSSDPTTRKSSSRPKMKKAASMSAAMKSPSKKGGKKPKKGSSLVDMKKRLPTLIDENVAMSPHTAKELLK